MTEEFANEEPATGWGFAIFVQMKRSLAAKLVKGGESLVGLRERELLARSNSPAVSASALSGLGTGKLALAQEECC